MTRRALILIDLEIVPPLGGLVAEEMHGGVVDAGDVFFRGQVLQAVGFVPAGGEDVEGDLPADGVAVFFLG